MTRTIHVMLLSLLSAGILTFCAPQPAHAQPSNSASGQYVNCSQVAADVSLMVRAPKLVDYTLSGKASMESDWYTRTVIAHARAAIKSDNPAQYVRDLHKSCLLETT